MTEYIVIDDKRDIALYSSLKKVCEDYGLNYSTVQKRMSKVGKEYFLKHHKEMDTELVIIHKCKKVKIKRPRNNGKKKPKSSPDWFEATG